METYKSINDLLDYRYQANAYSNRSYIKKNYEDAQKTSKRFTISLGCARAPNGYRLNWNLVCEVFPDGKITTYKKACG